MMMVKNLETFQVKFDNLGSLVMGGEAEIVSSRKSAKFSAYSFASAFPQCISLLAMFLFFRSAAISDVLEYLMADRRQFDVCDH
jgi:hypothetical protein